MHVFCPHYTDVSPWIAFPRHNATGNPPLVRMALAAVEWGPGAKRVPSERRRQR